MRTLRKIRVLRKKKGRAWKSSVDDKTKLLIGAGGLLLFIVGLKRTYRLDSQSGSTMDAGAPDSTDTGSPPPT